MDSAEPPAIGRSFGESRELDLRRRGGVDRSAQFGSGCRESTADGAAFRRLPFVFVAGPSSICD
jgi:hypothetical protein